MSGAGITPPPDGDPDEAPGAATAPDDAGATHAPGGADVGGAAEPSGAEPSGAPDRTAEEHVQLPGAPPEPDEMPVEPDDESRPPERLWPPPRRRMLSGVLSKRVVLVVVVLLVASNGATLAFSYLGGRDVRAAGDVGTVARRFAKNLVTFDYRTLDADIKRIEADSTGNFHKELSAALGGGVGAFKGPLVDAQARSRGTVSKVLVEMPVTGSTATAVVVAEQTISNKTTEQPQTVGRRLELTLVRTAKGWKVDSVDARGDT